MNPIRFAARAAVLGASIAAAQSNVWVVAPVAGPGVDFTQVQAAVAAAASGDVILVRTGTYGPVDIDAKALSITADAGSVPIILNSPIGSPVDVLRVRNLSLDQSVVLAGLTLDSSVFYAGNESPFEVTNSAGHVRVERCRLVGGSPNPLQNEIPGDDAAVVKSSSVVFVESDLLAGDGMNGSWNFATDGGVGLRAIFASVVLQGCKVAGGTGGAIDPTAGGAGCRAVASSVHVAGSELRAGDNMGKPGGTGLWLGSSSTAALLDSELLPGAGFPAGVELFVDGTSALAGLHGELHTLQLDSPLREGQVGTARFGGEAGELAFLVAGACPAQIPIGGVTGPLLVGGPPLLLALGVLPPSGSLAVPFTVQELGPSAEGVTLQLQGLFVGPLQVFLGECASLLLLDASF